MENVFTNMGLLDIALGHLSLGRALLGLALTSGESPDFTEAVEQLDRAVEGLRQSGEEEFVSRGLLARAALRRLCDAGSPSGQSGAVADLREAEEIAERGHMRLHEADVHLEWTRLHLAAGDNTAAGGKLERARELVAEIGYGRREREVGALAGQV